MTNSIVLAELDQVFTNVITGNLGDANVRLTGVESNRPAILDVTSSGGQLQFLVGGYVSGAGVQIQTSSNLTSAAWQFFATLPASTNGMSFSTDISLQNGPAYFRIRNAGL